MTMAELEGLLRHRRTADVARVARDFGVDPALLADVLRYLTRLEVEKKASETEFETAAGGPRRAVPADGDGDAAAT